YDSNLTLSCMTQVANSNSSIKHQVTHLAIKSDALKQSQAERNLLNFICTNLHSLTSVEIFTEHGASIHCCLWSCQLINPAPQIRVEDLLQLKQLAHLTELSLHAAEKSDLTSNRELRDYSYSNQIKSLKNLNLDIDLDPS